MRRVTFRSPSTEMTCSADSPVSVSSPLNDEATSCSLSCAEAYLACNISLRVLADVDRFRNSSTTDVMRT